MLYLTYSNQENTPENRKILGAVRISRTGHTADEQRNTRPIRDTRKESDTNSEGDQSEGVTSSKPTIRTKPRRKPDPPRLIEKANSRLDGRSSGLSGSYRNGYRKLINVFELTIFKLLNFQEKTNISYFYCNTLAHNPINLKI